MFVLKSKNVFLALLVFGLLLGMGFVFGAAEAKEYPSKPIEMVVPYAPGGGTHIAAEILVPGAEKFLGQPLQITTKPGAGGAIGATYVAKSKPDGYTLLYTTLSLAIAPYLGKVGYNLDDFVGIAQCSDVAAVIAVKADSPWNNAKDLQEWIKKNPGKFSWAHPGVGSSLHIQGANVFFAMGVLKDTKDVPFKGTAPGTAAVLGGHVQAISTFLPAIAENVKAKQLKVIGVGGPSRLPELAEVKTFKEQGFPALLTSWRGVFASKNTPPDVLKKLEMSFAQIIRSEAYKERSVKLGEPLVYKNMSEFTAMLRRDSKEMATLLKNMGLAKE